MRHLLLVMALFTSLGTFVTSCKKDDSAETVKTYPAGQQLDVAYGNHPRQKMDIYYPEGYNESTPVVFVIHGGGFVAGSKEDFTDRAKLFRDQGFVTVNLSHRLVDTTGLIQLPPVHKASEIKISDELEDVRSAVTKLRSMAPEAHIGTGSMFMAGHSAGAMLAMLYTQGDFNDDYHIRACGNWAGLTDMSIPHDSLLTGLDPRYIELLYRATGAMPSTANNLYLMAVSAYWVANINDGRPTISIYPENNLVLDIPGEAEGGLARTQKYHELLQNKGVKQKLSIYAGSDHGFSQPAGTWERLVKETAAFFREVK